MTSFLSAVFLANKWHKKIESPAGKEHSVSNLHQLNGDKSRPWMMMKAATNEKKKEALARLQAEPSLKCTKEFVLFSLLGVTGQIQLA